MDDLVCLLHFDSEDPEFARGFETGRVWSQLQADPGEPVIEIVHSANAEMLIRMGEATGRAFEADELGDGWMEIRFAAAEQNVVGPGGAG